MDLIVVRHGIAEDAVGRSDFERALTQEGVEKIGKLALFLKHHIGSADLIVSSPLVRAVETASILAKELSNPSLLEIEELHHSILPSESLREIARVGRDLNCMVAVGHEPNLSAVISLALSGVTKPIIDVSRGSAAHIKFHGQIAPAGGVLKFFVKPSLLGNL